MKLIHFTLLVSSALLAGGFGNIQAAPEPYSWNWSVADQSAIDLSRFLEAPAGKNGFVKIKDGHLVNGAGKRLRLWGVNITGMNCFPTKDQAPLLAADFARLGINVLRFHHSDADWGRCLFVNGAKDTQHFDPENIDRLDFFISELKKRGIYANLNLNVFRTYRENDGVRDYKVLGIGKAATYFNPRLIELQQDHARRLLTHRNPYTGNTYANEPAVATIEMVNENSILEAWCLGRLIGDDTKSGDTWSPIPVSYANELTAQYNQWLATHRSAEQLASIRSEAGVAAGAEIPRLHPDQFLNASNLRFHTEAEFLIGVESNFFAGMKHLLKDELGVKSLLVGSADHNHWIAGYAHIESNLLLDSVDGHNYWQHPDIGKITKIKNTPMVNEPLDSTFTQIARSPVVGRPFTISEINHPFPHRFAAEGYLSLTAYALFQDWDAIYWFDWERGRTGDPAAGLPPWGWFDVSQDPVKLAQLTAASILWHRQDVATARQTVIRSYSPEDIRETLRMNRDRLRLFYTPGFAISTPLEHATRWTLNGQSTPFPPAATLDRIESDTKELRWMHADQKHGIITVATPRSESQIGFVRDAGETTPHLTVSLTNEFSVVTLTSLDDQPLEQSRKLLLVATTGAAFNTGQKFADDGKTLAEWGKAPVLIDPVAGSITLKGLIKSSAVKATPLTPEGRLANPPLPVKPTADGWRVDLGAPATTWALIEITQ